MRDTKNWGKTCKKSHRNPNVCTGHPARTPHPDSIIRNQSANEFAEHPSSIIKSASLGWDTNAHKNLGPLVWQQIYSISTPKIKSAPLSTIFIQVTSINIVREYKAKCSRSRPAEPCEMQIGTRWDKYESTWVWYTVSQQKIKRRSIRNQDPSLHMVHDLDYASDNSRLAVFSQGMWRTSRWRHAPQLVVLCPGALATTSSKGLGSSGSSNDITPWSEWRKHLVPTAKSETTKATS